MSTLQIFTVLGFVAGETKLSSKSTKKQIEVKSSVVLVQPDLVSSVSRKSSAKVALSPTQVSAPLLVHVPPSKSSRRRVGVAKPRKLKGATATWPFPTGSRP